MELLTIVNKLIEYFNLDDIGDLGEKLREIVFSDNKNKVYEEYLDIVGDLETDWIQKIFQYYKSNREELNQDYTPRQLSKLLSKLLYYSKATNCYDACSGSGSLTLELFKLNNNLEFVCQEFDDNVIPYLLFNLSIHNVSAVVIRGDIIENKQFDFYKLTRSDKFSNIERINKYELLKYDIVISNPPFNIENFNINYQYDDLEIKKSSNSFFLLHCLEHLNEDGHMGIILPTGYCTSSKNGDYEVKQYLIENGLLESVIQLPGNFFESTGVNTTILYINKFKRDNKYIFIDSSRKCSEWIREQRGQFGGAAHTNRIYKKTFNTLSNENINEILDTVNKRKTIEDYSVCLSYLRILDKDYSLNVGTYFKVKFIKYVLDNWDAIPPAFSPEKMTEQQREEYKRLKEEGKIKHYNLNNMTYE